MWGSREARGDAAGKSKGLLRTSGEPDAQAQSSGGEVPECGFEGPVYGHQTANLSRILTLDVDT